MKKTRRLLSLLLAVPMLTCCIPLSAWAAEETADPSQSNAPYAWPLPSSGAITQGYSSDEHQALDIAIEEGTPVLAAESGTVVHTQVWDGVTMDGDQSYGNMVMLSHADGNSTLYAHLSEISVSPGDAVEKGSEIGKSGTTGNSTGPHLHLEVRTADGCVDPMKFLQGSQEPLSPEESETVSGESAPETQDASLEKKTAEAEYTLLPENGVSLQAAHQTKGTLISTGDINVFTDAPATDTFGEIGALMNKMMEYPDGSRDTAYCIELGVEVNYPEDYENVEDLIPDPQHLRLVGDALTFGFKAEDGRIDSAEENARYAATQILIWEILEGGFGSPQAAKDVLTCLEYTADPAEAKSFYRSLVEAVESKYVLPSFAAENAESAVPIELKWDETKYSAAVTDSNGALSRYRWSGDGLTFDQSGNTLTISADAPLSETIRLRANCETEGGPGAVICWQNKDPSRQNIATGWNASDTVSAYIAVSCESAGYLKIVKTSEDGQVSEIPFHISGNGIDRDVVTGPDGIIEVDGLQAGTYTVTEQTPDKYVQPASQQVEVFPGRVSSVSFSNILKKFTVEVKKVDAATGEAQGEASLDGAVYGLYKGETLLDTYTTENGGRFTTKMYPCGTDFSLREITPSEGYLLDKTVYPVGAEPGNFTLENNSIPITVTEDVVLGSIAITKHTDRPADDGNSDQIEQPEEGAEFQVYLASAGSYENAGESERDILRTDSNGFARSKDLPHGLYVVHQSKGEDGQKSVPDFTVFISEHVKTYYYILNNPSFTSLIRIEKRDVESGKIIPLAGAAFKIRNTDTGEWVVQHVNYPTPMDIDTFVTDATGTLMLPESMSSGNFELVEQQSPWGYVLSDRPVPFVVDGTQDIVTVCKFNAAQKGTITVSKKGEVFSHAAESDGMYQPQYEVQGQPGAVYDIIALEDIVTPDGAVHLKAGELATTLTTGPDGTATSAPLYLGPYQVLERTAPDGLVKDPEPKNVVLPYAGQEVKITSASVEFVNDRQKVEIRLKKLLEQDEIFSIGMHEEWKSVTFGLFAAEALTASDGTSIPADGLIETIGVDENGNAAFTTDVPCGASLYVKEIATDDHYILSDEKYPVVFEYAGQDVAVVEIDVNDGEAIENKLKRGKISGWKVDQDGFELGGAVIGLFRPDETEFIEKTALMVAESNEIGYFEFNNVPVGNWLVREIAPPAAFVLSEERFPVEITEDGQTIEITIENQIIRGIVETTKVDADYPDHKLSGAVFEIYADVDNNGKFDADVDRLVGEMAETEPGLYQLKDLACGNYLLHEKEGPEFFEKDDAYHPFSIVENGVVMRVETEAGVGFLNRAQTGSLKVIKTADDGSIEGRTFKITGADFMGNPYAQEFQTDENGEIHVELRVGKYTVSEMAGEDAEKYILPDDRTVEVRAGETVTVEMHNRLVPETPDMPQTGDHSSAAVPLGLTALSTGCIVTILMIRKHRSKRCK